MHLAIAEEWLRKVLMQGNDAPGAFATLEP
jgi:hypothetical protein